MVLLVFNRVLILILVALCNTPAFGELTFTPNYEVQGVVSFTPMRATNTLGVDQRFGFRFLLDSEGRWRCEVSAVIPGTTNNITSTEEIAYDKTNIFSMVCSDYVLGRNRQWIHKTNSSYSARVATGPYPTDHSTVVGLIWTIFIGGQYVDRGTNIQHFPNLLVTDARKDPLAWACDLRFSGQENGVMYSLENGSFILNKNYLEDSLKQTELDDPQTEKEFESLRASIRRMRAMHTNGEPVTVAEFRVDQFDVTNGVKFPARFSCQISDLNASDQSIQLRYSGIVTNIQTSVPKTSLRPLIRRITNVQDRRVRFKDEKVWRKDCFYMLSTRDGWILDVNDTRIQKALNMKPADRRIRTSYLAARFGILRILFIIVIVLPMFVLGIRWYRKTQA